MKRYLRVLTKLFQFSQVNFLEYRVDFFLTWIGDVVMAGTAVAFFWVVYGQTQQIAGWSRGEVLLLLAATNYLEAFIYFFYWQSISDILKLLPTGGLDIYLTRPIDFQFLLTFSKISPNTLGPLIPAVVLTWVGIRSLGSQFTPTQIILYAVLIVVGLVVHYCFLLMLTSVSFLVGRTTGMWEIDGAFRKLSSKPADVYPKYLRVIFWTAVPILFFGSLPVLVFRPGFSTWILVYVVIAAIVFLLLSRRLLRYCLRYYTSTGS